MHLGSPVRFFEKITTTNYKIIISSQMSDNPTRMGNERRRLAVEEGFGLHFSGLGAAPFLWGKNLKRAQCMHLRNQR